MLVMVQREVAERLCAPAGTPAYGAVSVKVAYWATARIVATVPASVFVPRPKVESALADIRRRPAPGRRRGARAVVPAGAHGVRSTTQDAAAIAGRCRRRRGVRRGGHRRDTAPGRARHRRVGRARPPRGWRRRECHRCGRRTREAHPEPAHHRCAQRRLPPDRCRDGHGRVARHGDHRSVIDRTDRRRAVRRGRAARRLEPRRQGAASRRSHGRASTSTRRCHMAAGSAAALPTPRPSCAGPVTPTSAAPRSSAPTSPSASSAAGPACAASASWSSRCRSQPLDLTLVVPPLSVSTPPVYRTWDALGGPTADGPNDLEPAAIAAFPALASWRDRIREATGLRADAGRERLDVVPARSSRPRLPPCPTAGSCSPAPVARRETAACQCCRRPRTRLLSGSLAALALVTGAPKHLLVLLLAHSLAAFLDQRTHSS